MSAFAKVEAVYEKFGAEEPFYAVLSYDKYKQDNLDAEQFFGQGKNLSGERLQAIVDYPPRNRPRARFGFWLRCGASHNALGRHFEEVIGVDVSSTMIENANKLRRSENCTFVVNKQQDLSLFGDDHFSFIYSDITIQHIPVPASENYIRDFLRILKPGGLALFLIPDGPLHLQGSLPARSTSFIANSSGRFTNAFAGSAKCRSIA